MTAPAAEIIDQDTAVYTHPVFSDIAAKRYVESALPTYVKAFTTPEMVEIFPYLPKYFGIREMSIRLIPCIHPVVTAMRKIAKMAYTLRIIVRHAVETVAVTKNTVDVISSFFIFSSSFEDIL